MYASDYEDEQRRAKAMNLIMNSSMTRADFDESWNLIPARRFNPDEQNTEAVAGKFEIRDSGARSSYSDGMGRDSVEGKPKFSLLIPSGMPYEETLLYRAAMHYMLGGIKYGDRNWEKSRTAESLEHHTEALWRHFMKFASGTEDGEDHAAAIFWNLNAVLYTRWRLEQELAKADASLAADDDLEDGFWDNTLPFQPPGRSYETSGRRMIEDPSGRTWSEGARGFWHRMTREPAAEDDLAEVLDHGHAALCRSRVGGENESRCDCHVPDPDNSGFCVCGCSGCSMCKVASVVMVMDTDGNGLVVAGCSRCGHTGPGSVCDDWKCPGHAAAVDIKPEVRELLANPSDAEVELARSILAARQAHHDREAQELLGS